jgi:hypothetical protein
MGLRSNTLASAASTETEVERVMGIEYIAEARFVEKKRRVAKGEARCV